MAPKRKSPATAAAPAMPSRITRSMAAGKQAADAPAKKEEPAAVPAPPPAPPPAPAGPKGKKKAKKEDAAVVVEEEDVGALLSPPAAAKQKGKKNAKKEVVAAAPAASSAAAAAKEEDDGAVVEDTRRVVVEACTQCQQFRTRALKVKKDVESTIPGVSVVINPAKPRRGCLEIREEGGEVFISLQDMKRPFQAMRDLDMDKVIQDIIKKIY